MGLIYTHIHIHLTLTVSIKIQDLTKMQGTNENLLARHFFFFF